jgi:succinyl-diaminopimelate desuccinylase
VKGEATVTPEEKAAWETKLDQWIEGHEALLVNMAARLMEIRSVRTSPQPGMPYGPGPAAALAEGMRICREAGFSVTNYDNHVGTADLNDGERKLDILVHLDVVDAGSGWETDPFHAVIQDGMLIGRGASDDKGPAAAAMLAMRALRETGAPLRYNVRLLLGTDEESGFSDLRYYYAREPYAPYTFSPDTEFPVVNTEKGRFLLSAVRNWKKQRPAPKILSVRGGTGANVVPAEAEAVVCGFPIGLVREVCARTEGETGVKLAVSEQADGVRIAARGINAHASRPEQGNNAVTALLSALCALPLTEDVETETLRALNAIFPHGDNDGSAVGIAMADDIAGELTLALTLFQMDEAGLSFTTDLRVPLCATRENCRDILVPRLLSAGFAVQGEMQLAHHVPEEERFVQTLLSCYERCTGEKGYCLAIGGNTYVHGIPGGVAFGCQMPGFRSNLHGAGERILVRDLLTAARIYASAIWEICS